MVRGIRDVCFSFVSLLVDRVGLVLDFVLGLTFEVLILDFFLIRILLLLEFLFYYI